MGRGIGEGWGLLDWWCEPDSLLVGEPGRRAYLKTLLLAAAIDFPAFRETRRPLRRGAVAQPSGLTPPSAPEGKPKFISFLGNSTKFFIV